MNPPRNPYAEAARAAMMAHNAPLLQNPPRDDAASLLSRALAQRSEPERYAYLMRYADTARVETVYDAQRNEWRECVTVTVYDPAAVAERPHDEQPSRAERKMER